MKVKIPFLGMFKEPLLSGIKTWTTRNKKYGEIGDIFEVFGTTFEITSVSRTMLKFVADNWSAEGCNSKSHFIEVWENIHYRKGYEPYKWVWVHIFKEVT